LIFDVDSLQRLNDARGHEAGDDCLRRIAAVIAGRVRRVSDISARYGGDEFAVMLACAEEPGALSVAHWIRAEIEKQQIPHGASSVSDYVTVSVGVAAVTPFAGMGVDSLVAGAEEALGRAKELGRNAVIASSAAVPFASR
jgi:diguanylate cyclase (GGDEF)-like protein